MAKTALATPGEEPKRPRKRKQAKRRFGRVRQLPSGRWQARYQGPDGIDRAAPETFPTKTDADVWLTKKEAEILDGDWINPDAGKITLGRYGRDWIAERPDLRPRTIELYSYLLRTHLIPTFGDKSIIDIKDAHVRRWRKKLLDAKVSAVTVAKAYRLLKAIFTTAVDDQLIKRNPCRIKGAGQEKSPERPVLTVAQVYKLAEAVGPRYRALVLLATFASLRWGEIAGLRRRDLDLHGRTVRVERQLLQITGEELTFTEPKSAAGKRIVAIPGLIIEDLREHLRYIAQDGDDGLIFVGPDNGPLRNTNFNRRVWPQALNLSFKFRSSRSVRS